MSLTKYKQKRHFDRTPEPSGARDARSTKSGHSFVIQKHAASRLHYDFRLEHDGVLKSWAVPKGPSLDPSVKSLAVQVEDHPLSYADFEGIIPEGEYGGGTVMVWDHGTWEPEGDADEGFRKGKLKFELHGEKLKGHWNLVQMHGPRSEGGKNWLLIKSDDQRAKPAEEYNITEKRAKSVVTGRTLDQIAKASDRVWSSNRSQKKSKPAKKPAKKAKVAKSTARKSARPKRAKSKSKRPKLPEKAKPARLPRDFTPQLATAVTEPPMGDDWLHELKYDGYRILCRIENGYVSLVSRRGNDWTGNFPTIVHAAEALGIDESIIDGEVVVLGKNGASDFQALQNLMRRGNDEDVVFYVFDLPFFDGHDLTQVPLIERKQVLAAVLENNGSTVIRYSDHILSDGRKVFAHACQHSLEGLVSKRVSSLYSTRRSLDWVKSKCFKRQEFVIGGWSDPGGSRSDFGSLLLGYYDHGDLKYCGRVGTGFTQQSLADVKAELDKYAADECPFVPRLRGADAGDAHWVEPKLVCEVSFAQWTSDNVLRQASFQGLREDKPPQQIGREMPKPTAAVTKKATSTKKTASVRRNKSSATVAGVRLSNPGRILYPESDITKLELANFYESIADWILPYVVNRPLSLVRCPGGRKGPCFFQKHLTDAMPEQLHGVEIEEGDATSTYVMIKDLAGLIGLVQMNVLEIHPWPAKADRLERPDRLVFDLDPGEGVEWKQVVQGARDVRDKLAELGLESFLRTSGGKGLHVVVPVDRKTNWDDFKGFAKSVADELMAEQPERYINTLSKAKRKGKIFIDYLRNGRGATAIASYSTRAREGAPVATPLDWDELSTRLKPNKFNLRNLQRRLSSLDGVPWGEFAKVRQRVPASHSSRP